MNIKGLQYIPKPLSRVASHTAPRSREQILSELASRQRQEGRLEKKLIIWRNNQRQTEHHLRRVQKRRTFLERVLDQKPADKKSGDSGGQGAATWRGIPLKY